jgi:hypothetical protein
MSLSSLPRIGTPYAYPSTPPESYDCWTLVEHVRAALGLATPLAVDAANFDPESLDVAVAAELGANRWCEVGAPHDGAVVVFHAGHVGVWVQCRVLHAVAGVGVMVSRWPTVLRRFPGARVVELRP